MPPSVVRGAARAEVAGLVGVPVGDVAVGPGERAEDGEEQEGDDREDTGDHGQARTLLGGPHQQRQHARHSSLLPPPASAARSRVYRRASGTDLTAAPDEPLGAGELTEAHRATGVELLRGDAD